MKKLTVLLASLVLTAAFASDLSEADQKWSSAVEKMIQSGADKISTPSANRAELAVKLAKKHNRTATTEKDDNGYTVTFSAPAKGATVA